MQRAKEIFWAVVEGVCDAISEVIENFGNDED